ncbi:MAG: NADH-quinone oxidoreductase subunit N [Chloroflexi bacterium]|nr:NADH-quinone oxidoreductase subunit N [Chloroflexota bacterium]
MDIPTLESLNLLAVLPAIILAAYTGLLLVVDLFIPNENKQRTALLAILGLGATGVALGVQINQYSAIGDQMAFGGLVIVDGYALFLQGIFLLSAILGILMAMNYLPRRGIERGEYYSLILFTTVGSMFMALANDLMVVFVALELLSIPLYVLSAFIRDDPGSEEAGMKYFLLGAFSSAFFVYGVALIYGGTGTTSLDGVAAVLAGEALNLPLALVGMGLLLVGLGFKVAAFPFHMWTPDVYQGAPTAATGFMSVGAKVAGFAALIRVLVTAFPGAAQAWGLLVIAIAILTMILGNVTAISQSNAKRMLAYSSIAHAGYILVALSAAQFPELAQEASSAALFYMLTYTITNLGAFAVVMAIEKDDGSGVEIEDFAGLAKSRPAVALMMLIFMLSLTGLPVSAGMVGKFFVFGVAINAASQSVWLAIVAIVGVLTSVVSAFYYMRIVYMMYMRDGDEEAEYPAIKPALGTALAVTGIGTLVLGFLPTLLFDAAQRALIAGL